MFSCIRKLIGLDKFLKPEQWTETKKEKSVMLRQFEEDEREKDRKSAVESGRVMKEIQEREKNARRVLMPSLRKASKSDYDEWLSVFLAAGGKPTHYYEYPWDRWEWYIAKEDFELVPLFGASSINIIVPSGIKYRGDKGHIQLFTYDNLSKSFVPTFIDTCA